MDKEKDVSFGMRTAVLLEADVKVATATASAAVDGPWRQQQEEEDDDNNDEATVDDVRITFGSAVITATEAINQKLIIIIIIFPAQLLTTGRRSLAIL